MLVKMQKKNRQKQPLTARKTTTTNVQGKGITVVDTVLKSIKSPELEPKSKELLQTLKIGSGFKKF